MIGAKLIEGNDDFDKCLLMEFIEQIERLIF